MTNSSDFCPLVRELDASTKFFIWDFDIVCAFFAGLSIGIMIASLMLGALLGLIFAKGLSRLKQGRHPGFGLHLLYWHLPLRFFRRMPLSHRRHFIG